MRKPKDMGCGFMTDGTYECNCGECGKEYVPEPMRSAVVCTESWAGRIEKPVKVQRETAKRYCVIYSDGHAKYVPKYAVRFTDAPNIPPPTSIVSERK